MGSYQIADVTFCIEPKGQLLAQMLAPYAVSGRQSDATLSPCDPETEINQVLQQLSLQLLDRFDGIVLHSAALVYRGKAYLFTAPPGTGKSTHALLWKEKLKEQVQILNGDKPLLRLRNGGITVYGSPWQGKERLGYNGSAPLGGIYLLRRGNVNRTAPMDPIEALAELLSATVYPPDATGIHKLVSLFSRLTQQIPVRILYCRPDLGAVDAVLMDLEEQP